MLRMQKWRENTKIKKTSQLRKKIIIFIIDIFNYLNVKIRGTKNKFNI